MNKYMLVAAVFLLTGCPGPMDPLPLEQPAQARLVNNQVCITVPVSTGDKIFSVQLDSDSGREVYKTFGPFDQQIRVAQDECLPTFGFEFKPGDTYAAFYQLENNNTGPGRLFAARFSLEQNANGSLRLTQHSRNE